MSRVGAEYVSSDNEPYGRVLASDGTSGAMWLAGGAVPGARNLPMTFTFYDSNSNPYLEYVASGYKAVSSLIYAGTNEFTPAKFSIVGSRQSTATGDEYANVRLYDITNALVICTVQYLGDTTPVIYDTTTFTNLPATRAIWEIQVSGSGPKVRIHYMVME